MATSLDKLQKHGVKTSFDYDIDDELSLSASRRTALVPLYRPQWAYNLINSEQVFENIEEDDYIESLW